VYIRKTVKEIINDVCSRNGYAWTEEYYDDEMHSVIKIIDLMSDFEYTSGNTTKLCIDKEIVL
jgi:hypothetical protein